MNPLLLFFMLAIFIEDYIFRQGKFIKYYLYTIGLYCIFYYFQHKSTFHSYTKKFNMAAFDQSYDSTVYARVKYDMTKAKEYLKKLKEKTGKDIDIYTFFIKVLGEVFVKVPESNEKLLFGMKSKRNCVDVSLLTSAKHQDLTFLTLRDVPNKTLVQVNDEILTDSEKLLKGQDEEYKKTKKFLKLLPTFLLNIVLEIKGVMSLFGINLPSIGLKKNQYGSVIVCQSGKLGLKDIYIPLIPYSQNIGVFNICEVEVKKKLNLDGTISVTEYLPVNFTLDHRYMDGVLSSKMVKVSRSLFEDPESFQIC